MSRLTPISRKRFEKFLVFNGCQLKRRQGSHLIYDRADLKRPIILTVDKEVPAFVIHNSLHLLKIDPENI